MNIFPAIDLYGGKVVRLYKGDYANMTVYSENPIEIAVDFESKGCTHIHMVDLEGAKDGTTANFATIQNIVRATGLSVEVGGGIRTEERIQRYLDLGVERCILGTIAVKDFDFTAKMAQKYGKHIAVGVDARDGFVAINGWKELSAEKGVDFCRRLRDAGVQTVIYTDISRDGAEMGTNLELYQELSAIEGLNIIASGGISFESELLELERMGVWGAILGKALYTGKLDLPRAVQLVQKEVRA
jgi:phosphoribosylformimino-5-aminoimidazole carboxamide ribotide isomerase